MIVGDALVGANLADLRERAEMTQKQLADEMRVAGHRWSQATVWSVEKGDRPLRLIEAVDAAEVLSATVDDLWSPSELAAASRSLHDATTRLAFVRDQLQRWDETLRLRRASLAQAISRLEALGVEAKCDAMEESIEFRLWAAKKQLDEEDDGEHRETP